MKLVRADYETDGYSDGGGYGGGGSQTERWTILGVQILKKIIERSNKSKMVYSLSVNSIMSTWIHP